MVYFGELKLEPVTNCFCNSSNFEVLSRYDRYGLPFGTQICRDCGLISQTINIAEASMEKFYDKIYWLLMYGTEDDIEYSTQLAGMDKFIPFICDDMNFNKKKIKILEIGVGEGNRIRALADNLQNRYDLELYGNDYSTDALKKANSKGIKIIQGSMDQCLDIGPADILILSHIFEHFVDLNVSLDLIDKLTHDNSIVYVEVPGIIDLENKPEYMYDYQDFTVLAHIHNFSLATLSNVFRTKGFQLKKGDEYIRAIFMKNCNEAKEVNKKPYEQIINSLNMAREKHIRIFQGRAFKYKSYIKNVIKVISSRY